MIHRPEHGVCQIQEEWLRSPKFKLCREDNSQIQGGEGWESLLSSLGDGRGDRELPSGQPSAAGVRPETLRGDCGPGRAAVVGGRLPLQWHPLHWMWCAVTLEGLSHERGPGQPETALTLEVLHVKKGQQPQTHLFRINGSSVYLLWVGIWMSCQWFSFDLVLDWIKLGLGLKTLLPCDQSTLIPSTFVCLSVSKLEPYWSRASAVGYHLSLTLFVPRSQ